MSGPHIGLNFVFDRRPIKNWIFQPFLRYRSVEIEGSSSPGLRERGLAESFGGGAGLGRLSGSWLLMPQVDLSYTKIHLTERTGLRESVHKHFAQLSFEFLTLWQANETIQLGPLIGAGLYPWRRAYFSVESRILL